MAVLPNLGRPCRTISCQQVLSTDAAEFAAEARPAARLSHFAQISKSQRETGAENPKHFECTCKFDFSTCICGESARTAASAAAAAAAMGALKPDH